MNAMKSIIILILVIIIITIGVYIIIDKNNRSNNIINNLIDNSTNNSLINNLNITTDTPSVISDNNLTIVPNDYLINHISWKSYPNLEVGYVIANEVLGPNELINHSYIGVEVASEVKDTDNDTIINNQLSAEAHEIRQIYGPNTAIVAMGMDHGVLAWSVTMGIYDDTIYY